MPRDGLRGVIWWWMGGILLGEVFWKQILHKSIINLCFDLSSIAAEHHLEQIFGRPVFIGRPLYRKPYQPLQEKLLMMLMRFFGAREVQFFW